MPTRNVRYDPSCEAAADTLGGYEAIDEGLLIHLEALQRNPEGFPKIEVYGGSVRVIVTKPFGKTPSLVWLFVIEANGDVLLTHVEEHDP